MNATLLDLVAQRESSPDPVAHKVVLAETKINTGFKIPVMWMVEGLSVEMGTASC